MGQAIRAVEEIEHPSAEPGALVTYAIVISSLAALWRARTELFSWFLSKEFKISVTVGSIAISRSLDGILLEDVTLGKAGNVTCGKVR